MTIRQDDRTQEEMKTHYWLVTATDKFMSGWGRANGGLSKCAWACRPEDVDAVYDWVKNRSDMKYVNIRTTPWYPVCKHVHIYVVRGNHPAIAG